MNNLIFLKINSETSLKAVDEVCFNETFPNFQSYSRSRVTSNYFFRPLFIFRLHSIISPFLYFQQQPQVETLTKETVQTFRPGNRTERKVTTSQKKNSQQIGEYIFSKYFNSCNSTFFEAILLGLRAHANVILIRRFRYCRRFAGVYYFVEVCQLLTRIDVFLETGTIRDLFASFVQFSVMTGSKASIVFVFPQGHFCGKIW